MSKPDLHRSRQSWTSSPRHCSLLSVLALCLCAVIQGEDEDEEGVNTTFAPPCAVQSADHSPSLPWLFFPRWKQEGLSPSHCPIWKRKAMSMKDLVYHYNGETDSLLKMVLT